MHGAQALLFLFVVVFLLNIPTFLFGFLATKCILYLIPSGMHYLLVRWVLPIANAFGFLLFGMGLTVAYLERPWPTSPTLSGWQCLDLLCVLDLLFLILWPILHYRERRRRETIAMPMSDAKNESPEFAGRRSNGISRDASDCLSFTSRRSAFWQGFSAPGAGFVYLMKNRGLWSYAVIPVALNLLITTLACVIFVLAAIGFSVYLHPFSSPDWGGLALEILCVVGLLVLALFATLITWVLLQGIVCGYFYGKLARAVELNLGLAPENIKDPSLSEEVFDTLHDLASLILINVGFLILHLIPVLGSIASIAGTVYFDCYLLGREYIELPLALRGWSRNGQLAFARRFRTQTLGLGTIVLLVTFIPVVSSVVLTTAVVGSVLLHRRLADVETCSESRLLESQVIAVER